MANKWFINGYNSENEEMAWKWSDFLCGFFSSIRGSNQRTVF